MRTYIQYFLKFIQGNIFFVSNLYVNFKVKDYCVQLSIKTFSSPRIGKQLFVNKFKSLWKNFLVMAQ